jgi:hypothetical protein
MSTWILITGSWNDSGIWLDEAPWLDGPTEANDSLNQIRAFAFSLDGHDFYALRLGANETLLYDLTTGAWCSWDSPGRNVWRANSGVNWVGVLGSGDAGLPATNILLGDDTFGTLWGLDPASGSDDGPFDGDTPQTFTRTVTGGVPIRGRPSPRCNAVYLTASIGDPDMTDTSIQLRYSDDNGRTYQTAGTVIVQPGVYYTELRWRSLGILKAPGRIFEFIDSGATVRIDGADARLNNETE